MDSAEQAGQLTASDNDTRSADICHPSSCATHLRSRPSIHDIDELTSQIVEFWENKGRESPKTEGTGRAVRGAHAKPFGVVKAEVEIIDDAPAPYAQGIYARPGRHGALIRFSNAANHLGTDAQLGPARGFAIKVFDVAGTKLVEDEPDSHDLRPRAQEQPGLHRQHRRALSVHPGARRQRPQVPRARQGGFRRTPHAFSHWQGNVSSQRTGHGASCSRS